ncbi:MAG TPA: glycosyltransferase family 2 protein [Gammaproteobacteria bacterium]|nr:glycosyltransferase family 2 protein [Gammaproteobacteria bacterium]
MTSKPPALSVVVPVYNGADTIEELVTAVCSLPVEGGLEMVLVHDAGTDNSWDILKKIAANSRTPVTIINHARNYGEHNTVMTGLRHARGEYVITMDDDLQNPPEELLKLYRQCRERDLDVVYAVYAKKEHATWRNLGSKFANQVADWISDKPRGLYLSTFRCMNRFLVDQLVGYTGPFVYIDGLIFQVTRRAESVEVLHLPNRSGRSNYTLGRLVNLWATILIGFSVKPLRISTAVGVGMFIGGLLGALYIVFDQWLYGPVVSGWSSLACLILVFTGTQFLVLGLLGEYVGRAFLTINGKPQSAIRDIMTSPDIRPTPDPKAK